ncbi:ABC-2 type transport system permease protein [Natranaerovirga hydrolytica]|uniref:ABC-2 type transport system permease protein n=1 Tax=Natranaerovirga hydrolytica TaxID=680378 RepID=A0A4R1MZR0_9FIRM|nr:hypothetical protein [Natranaerovirga hydrolytica]TCK98776.1 ABC-2 type transport system permease protein [Natranaerovirga hydrolytica]
MTEKTWTLFKVELINSFNINHLSLKEKSNPGAKITFVGICLISLVLLGYNYLTANTLYQLGETSLIPTYMISVSSIVMLFITLLRANGTIFGSKDFQSLSSLPINDREIIVSKLLYLYTFSLVLSLLFVIPGNLIWIIHAKPTVLMVVSNFLVVILNPLIPVCLSAFLGIFIYQMTSKLKNPNLIAVLLSLLLFGGVFSYIMIHSNNAMDIHNIGSVLYEQLNYLYVPSLLAIYSTEGFSILNHMIYIFIAIALLFVFIHYAHKNYRIINFRLLASTGNTSKQTSIQVNTPLVSLYKNEMIRLFNSYTYLLNTTLGSIVLLVFSMVFLVFGTKLFTDTMGLPFSISQIQSLYPLVIAAMIAISTPASCALSMEGHKIWVLKSLPIPTKTIVNAKLFCSFSIHFPMIGLSLLAYILHFSPSLNETILCFLVPFAYSIFVCTFGLFVNFLFPKFDWSNETYVVKQSPSVMINGLIGMVTIIVPIQLTLFNIIPVIPTLYSMIILLLLISVILYKKMALRNLP